ncbi:MAG: orotate phosphoribosyltransferase [Candidatus Atribacteria bacterium]|nr:orotate phosphoribosyltransferase [Candidatus Atribacteria bacterium]MCD6349780.1 orotate phosphoribosyltransferase [Candidatus Atribacteria bacterium]
MEEKEILDLFREAGAFLEGHFLLTSGLHSPVYIEKFRLLQFPRYVEILAREIIRRVDNKEAIELVVGPAVGGIVLAYEVARQLGVRMAFTEREEGKMCFRRDFQINEGEKVLIVEDVVTTGGSLQEVIKAVEAEKGNIIGISVLVDRSGGKVHFDYPFFPLLQVEVKTYSAEECPLCKQKIELQKRGSRYLQ